LSTMVVPGSQHKLYHPPEGLQKDAHVPDFNCYLELYKKSIEEPDVFWKEVASDFYWKKPPTGQILQYNFDVTKGNIYVKCMEGATTNMCYNVLDRNVKDKNLGERVAFYWEGNSPDHREAITYGQLLGQVCRCSNTLKQMGVRKGDRVAIYLPMIPELVYTMLACTRIGAVHSIVFAGFSAESLCERIMDSQCSILVTADGVYRGEKLINLKQIADEALEKCRENIPVETLSTPCRVPCPDELRLPVVFPVVQTPWDAACDVCWEEVMGQVSEQCEPEWLDAEDPLFILYTSGSTGKPKGVLHTVAGYLLYTSLTFKYVFDHQPDDVYWCTADIGWITGHSYITYGPLANGATSVLFEGIPVHPHVGRFWEVIEKYRVTKFYTAPTAIRLLMKYGLDPVQKYDLSSLRILGTVGEPINPEAWHWYHEVIGQKRCPVVDTFWQTETGGHVLTPLPAATPLKPGSAVSYHHIYTVYTVFRGRVKGRVKEPRSGMLFTYFKKFPGFYVTGDGCRRDKDGYYWIAGRIDDMINVSGHLLSTAEVEASLTDHGAVAEAAVVSRPHTVKGECLYCFVTLKDCREFNRTLVDELKRQGKIMRRVLRQIARNEKDLGDLSTMADPKVVEVLFNHRCETAS
uniref:Propionate--CoA ligase n=1 Tax=Oncorhynchus kisutch TaxID=8019 RepID=A0A8C7I9S1_ONCKI